MPVGSSFAHLLRSAIFGRCEKHKHALRLLCKAICGVLKAAVGVWETSTDVCMQLVGLRLVGILHGACSSFPEVVLQQLVKPSSHLVCAMVACHASTCLLNILLLLVLSLCC